MENKVEKPEEFSKEEMSKDKEKSPPSESEKKESVDHPVTDNMVQAQSIQSPPSNEAKPEEIFEENTGDSPFALQSLVDVPDFEFMGADGSYQTPFY